jgi:hypothetical protein
MCPVALLPPYVPPRPQRPKSQPPALNPPNAREEGAPPAADLLTAIPLRKQAGAEREIRAP